MGKNDKIIIITVVTVTLVVLAATGILFLQGKKGREFLKAKADAARQNALKGGASKLQAEKQATLAMVAPQEKSKVEKELAKITAGKTELQAEVAVKQYQAKIEEENSGIVATLTTGVQGVMGNVPNTMTKSDFSKVFTQVVDRLEGGYFHPNMMAANERRFKKYGHSGETMYGLDRHAGHDHFYSSKRKSADVKENLKYIPTYTYSHPEAKEFWETIDSNNASKNWEWNYNGGALAPRLKDLAAGMMYPNYEKWSKRYLTPKARALVGADKRLTFHFIRAIWNGEGWFKGYAEDMNKAVDSGVSDLDKLVQVAMDSRVKSIYKGKFNQEMSDGGKKIASFINQLT